MNNLEREVEEIKARIKRAKFLIENTSILPDEEQFDFPVVTWFSYETTDPSYQVRIPWDAKIIREYRTAMRGRFKIVKAKAKRKHPTTYHSKYEASRPVEYRHLETGIKMLLVFETKAEGASCKMVEIGTEEVKKYAVKCTR